MGGFDWEVFAKLHRPETVVFCKEFFANTDIGSEKSFVDGIKKLGLVRMPPNKARHIYKFLVKHI